MKPQSFAFDEYLYKPVAVKKHSGKIFIGKVGDYDEEKEKVKLINTVLIDDDGSLEFFGDVNLPLREIGDISLVSDEQHDEYLEKAEEDDESIEEESEEEDGEVSGDEGDEESEEEESDEPLNSEVRAVAEDDSGIDVVGLAKKVPSWAWIAVVLGGLYLYNKNKKTT